MNKYVLVNNQGTVLLTREIDANLVPENSLLDIMTRRDADEQGTVYTKDPNIEYVIWYLENMPIVRDELAEQVLSEWGVYDNYDMIWNDEKNIRANMYLPEFETHEMNTTHYFNLIKMDDFQERQSRSSVDYEKPDDLIFNSPYSIVTLYQNTLNYLNRLRFLFDIAKKHGLDIVIAGEYIFRAVMGFDDLINVLPVGVGGVDFNDLTDDLKAKTFNNSSVNVFFFSVTLELLSDYLDNVTNRIAMIVKGIGGEMYSMYGFEIKISRTEEFVSIQANIRDINVIKINFCLRVYRTFSEVLHSFDIDSNCIGYDGADVWCTKRCEYALMGGFNTLNPDLTSTDYLDRLARIGSFGLSIRIPGVDEHSINREFVGVDLDIDYRTNTKLRTAISTLSLLKPYIDSSLTISKESDIKSAILADIRALENKYRYILKDNTDFLISHHDNVYTFYSSEQTGVSRILDLEYKFIEKKRPINSVSDVLNNEEATIYTTSIIKTLEARVEKINARYRSVNKYAVLYSKPDSPTPVPLPLKPNLPIHPSFLNPSLDGSISPSDYQLMTSEKVLYLKEIIKLLRNIKETLPRETLKAGIIGDKLIMISNVFKEGFFEAGDNSIIDLLTISDDVYTLLTLLNITGISKSITLSPSEGRMINAE